MALVKDLKSTSKERQAVHEETECLYSHFQDGEGRKYLQLDTYGSKTRKMPQKVSQSVQFDREAAFQLKRIIEELFGE